MEILILPLCSCFVAFSVERILVDSLNRASQLIGFMHKEYIRALEHVLCIAADFVWALLCFVLVSESPTEKVVLFTFGSDGGVLPLGFSWSKEESYCCPTLPWGMFLLEACCGEASALWNTDVPGGAWLYCFEAVRLGLTLQGQYFTCLGV